MQVHTLVSCTALYARDIGKTGANFHMRTHQLLTLPASRWSDLSSKYYTHVAASSIYTTQHLVRCDRIASSRVSIIYAKYMCAMNQFGASKEWRIGWRQSLYERVECVCVCTHVSDIYGITHWQHSLWREAWDHRWSMQTSPQFCILEQFSHLWAATYASEHDVSE